MATVIDRKTAEAKLQAMFNALETRIPEEALLPTLVAMAKDAASRAPTPSQEYNTMMYGGNDGFKNSSPTDGFAITDEDNRVRFYKPSRLYLRNVIPTSYTYNGLMGHVGIVSQLNRASTYTYVNYTKSGGMMSHEVESIEYPFWRAWENGGRYTIEPKYASKAKYPLRPSVGVKIFRMTKVIPAKGMYRGLSTQRFVDKILIPKIRKIVKSI